jgi:hypothetical protein
MTNRHMGGDESSDEKRTKSLYVDYESALPEIDKLFESY